MKLILTGILTLMIAPTLFGQVITVNAQGLIEEVYGTQSDPSVPILNPSVQPGTPFTFTYTINSQAPATNEGGAAEYTSNSPYGVTLAVGNYTFTFASNQTTVSFPGYDLFSGYDVSADGLSDILSSVRLLGTSISLPNDSLNSIKVFPVSDFNIFNSMQLTVGDDPQVPAASGVITSYTVTEAVPEPSAWAFLTIGVAALVLLACFGRLSRQRN
jgi:hypothetical protein